MNDELDQLRSLSQQYPAAVLAAQAAVIHQQSVQALRGVPSLVAVRIVKLAARESSAEHADEWDGNEAEAVEHLVHTLAIIGLGFPQPEVGAEPAHARVMMNGHPVDILAIRGSTHEACSEHGKAFLRMPGRQVLLVSRDRDNTHWLRRFGSFLQPIRPQLGDERKITDPVGGALHLGYHRLLEMFRASTSVAALQGAINAELVA